MTEAIIEKLQDKIEGGEQRSKDREKRFTLYISVEEMEMLKEIAKLTNRSKNGSLKMLIRYGWGYFVKKENMPEREREVT